MLNDHGDATEVLSVRSRPVRNPIFLGLGTAAILAAGGATNAVLADATPTPSPSPSGSEGSTPGASDTPTPTPTPTESKTPEAVLELDVAWTQSTKTVHAGTVVKGTVHVKASGAAAAATHLTATASGATVGPACATQTGGCTLKPISAGTVFDYTGLTVKISSSKTSGTTVPLTITVKDGSAQATVHDSITVARTPTSSTTKTTHETSSGGSGNTGGSGGSSNSSGGSGGSTSNNTTTSIPGSGSAYIPPSAAGQLAPATNGTAQFPQIAPQNGQPGAAPPAVVADQAAQNMGAVRGASPEPQELTFQRLASTQAAWLAALLVAFSLLLTHIRLNKPADARRRKGGHRRQRTGVFQA
jgi:hypothetical protein